MFNAAINQQDHRFNPLEMSQSLQHTREPHFCYCVPLAKGVCCGLISLKIALVIIALVDFTIGGAAVGIGITAFMKNKLHTELAVFIFIQAVSLVLAIAGLWAIVRKKTRVLRFYFWWKCIEVIAIPIFEIFIVFTNGSGNGTALQ